MLDKVTCYIFDVPMEENSGYKYGTTTLKAIEVNEKFKKI